MRTETTPKGEKFVSATMGEVFPECFEKLKDDSLRFTCILKQGTCPKESVCFVNFQRAVQKIFKDNPEAIGAHLTWSTDKKKYLSKISKATMIHSVFEVKEDKYNPVDQENGDKGKEDK